MSFFVSMETVCCYLPPATCRPSLVVMKIGEQVTDEVKSQGKKIMLLFYILILGLGAMDQIANQNVASSSAPAEKRISAQEMAAAMRVTAESPPSDVKDPGQPAYELESELLIYSKNLEIKFKNEQNLSGKMNVSKEHDSDTKNVQIGPESCSPGQMGNSPQVSGLGTPRIAPNTEFCTSSEEEEGEFELNCEKLVKKSGAPAQYAENYGLPATIVADMREFIKSMKPSKFAKTDNAATRLVSKFRKSLVCPKCEALHGHTSQGTSSNQYGGTAPFKCRSSVPQLIMMLPHEIICAIGKVHREFCIKDAQLFAAWISSSKAAQKEVILKRLRNEMDIDKLEAIDTDEETNDFQDVEMSQEDINLENLKIDEEEKKDAVTADATNYSDAEFRAVVIAELSSLRKRLNEVLDENKALRQENAVLKKYRPSLVEISPIKLPIGTTSLAPIATYSDVTKLHTPRQFTTIKRSRQEAGAITPTQPKSRPQVDLSLFTAEEPGKDKMQETSRLTFVYFKGLTRRPQSEYRALFDQIGFGGYKARDILFLSKDFLQVLTYENCVNELVEKIIKNFPTAKHVNDADPTDPKNYEEHGNLSQKFLEAQYFVTMESAVQRFKKLAVDRPVLTRTLHFLEKVVETKNIKYEKAPSKPKIFLMNNFMVLQDLQDSIATSSAPTTEQNPSAMETDQITGEPEACSQVPMETSQ